MRVAHMVQKFTSGPHGVVVSHNGRYVPAWAARGSCELWVVDVGSIAHRLSTVSNLNSTILIT